jgi:hypothetical protein
MIYIKNKRYIIIIIILIIIIISLIIIYLVYFNIKIVLKCKVDSDCINNQLCINGECTNNSNFNEIPFKYTSNKLLQIGETPTYQDIALGSNGIWNCGTSNENQENAMCYMDNGEKTTGNDAHCVTTPNPWYSKCCKSPENCKPTGKFNWIIGTCLKESPKQESCNINPNKSEIIVNYVGSYQYDSNKKMFICQQDSSFNMDGKHQPYNCAKVYGGLDKNSSWLPGPLPGGAANWNQGYYPAGRSGVGAPGMLFIISVNKIANSCWYVLNQSDLDRGPQNSMPSPLCNYHGNTWECNNSGEFDFVEPICAGGAPKNPNEFKKGFTTAAYNEGQNSRCLFWSQGKYGNGGGGWGNSSKYFTVDVDGDPEISRIFVGIVDQMGMRVYQIPGNNPEKYWSGIRVKSADMTLKPFPNMKPNISPCNDKTSFCAVFCPICPVNADPKDFSKLNCLTAQQNHGFCGNWFKKLDFLGPQSLWGTDGLKPTVNGQVIGNWNADMESKPL